MPEPVSRFGDVGGRSARLLLMGACLVVIVAGLNAAEAFFLPLLMAVFLSILCLPPLAWLRRRGLPRWAATTVVILGACLAVLGVAAIVGGSIQRFYTEIPEYRARLDAIVQGGLAYLERHGIELATADVSSRIDTGAVLELAAGTAGGLVSAFSNMVIVLLVTGFLLAELAEAPQKLRRAMGDPQADLSAMGRGAEQVQKYLGVKTFMSLLNAAMALVICFGLGIDYALLWGLLAFLFNYVPNVGSILAGIPPVLLALVQYGYGRALLIAGLYLAIDLVLGNVLEPRLMGRRLSLSPLVVMLSLLFWGWLWGPVGMLLSVPLTSALKLLLEHTEDLRWVAILLGSGHEPPAGGDAGAQR